MDDHPTVVAPDEAKLLLLSMDKMLDYIIQHIRTQKLAYEALLQCSSQPSGPQKDCSNVSVTNPSYRSPISPPSCAPRPQIPASTPIRFSSASPASSGQTASHSSCSSHRSNPPSSSLSSNPITESSKTGLAPVLSSSKPSHRPFNRPFEIEQSIGTHHHNQTCDVDAPQSTFRPSRSVSTSRSSGYSKSHTPSCSCFTTRLYSPVARETFMSGKREQSNRLFVPPTEIQPTRDNTRYSRESCSTCHRPHISDCCCCCSFSVHSFDPTRIHSAELHRSAPCYHWTSAHPSPHASTPMRPLCPRSNLRGLCSTSSTSGVMSHATQTPNSELFPSCSCSNCRNPVLYWSLLHPTDLTRTRTTSPATQSAPCCIVTKRRSLSLARSK